MPLTPTSTGYQLPRVNPMGQMPQGKQGLVAQSAAQMKQYSPQSQLAQFQQQASADPNADPMQNFYNMQQLSDMRQSAQAEDEAKKAALQQQWGEAYGIGQPQGGQAQAGGSKYINQAAQNRYAQRNVWGQ